MELKLFAYRNSNSLIHKIPAIIKILFLMFFCIAAFKINSFKILAALFLFSAVFLLASKARLTSFFCLKYVLILGIFVSLFRIFEFDFSQKIFIIINKNELKESLLYTLKFAVTALFAQGVFETTSSLQIKNCFDSIHDFLSKIFPPLKKSNFSLTLSLAINFIPQVFSAWNKISFATKARSEKTKNIFKASKIIFFQLKAFFLYIFDDADKKHKALLNRS